VDTWPVAESIVKARYQCPREEYRAAGGVAVNDDVEQEATAQIVAGDIAQLWKRF